MQGEKGLGCLLEPTREDRLSLELQWQKKNRKGLAEKEVVLPLSRGWGPGSEAVSLLPPNLCTKGRHKIKGVGGAGISSQSPVIVFTPEWCCSGGSCCWDLVVANLFSGQCSALLPTRWFFTPHCFWRQNSVNLDEVGHKSWIKVE